MLKNCRTECPLYQECQPHFRTVSAMAEAALTATSVPDASPETGTVTMPVLTGVALEDDPNASLYADTAAAEVTFINAREGCGGSKLTFAGKLLTGLRIHDATSGKVASREELDEIKSRTAAAHQKCPSRKAHAAYRMVKKLQLLTRQ